MSGTREVSPTKTRIDPIKDDTSSQCWANVDPPSTTLVQHWSNIGSMCRVCWDGSATGPALYHLHGLACLLPVILWKPMQKESSWCRGHTQMLGHRIGLVSRGGGGGLYYDGSVQTAAASAPRSNISCSAPVPWEPTRCAGLTLGKRWTTLKDAGSLLIRRWFVDWLVPEAPEETDDTWAINQN